MFCGFIFYVYAHSQLIYNSVIIIIIYYNVYVVPVVCVASLQRCYKHMNGNNLTNYSDCCSVWVGIFLFCEIVHNLYGHTVFYHKIIVQICRSLT